MSKATLFDSRIKKYAYCKPPEICRDLGTSALGLSKEQVDAMRERYGKNSFQERKTDTTIQRLRRAFINPFHVILFILGIVSLVTDVFMASNFTRNATTALIIFSMIVISGIIRLIQELRAKSTAAQLDRLIHEKVTVRRNGELREIPGEELVVGDLVLFSAGDRVPADIRLTKVTDLFISQAAITGESAILEKSCRTLCYKEQEPITQLENLAFMATTVISGKGEGIVLAVGTDTLYGGFTKPDSEDKNAFQKGANSIAWVMIRFMAVLVPIVFLILGITGGKWLESFAFALSVAVGLMPEMLPMVITACLAKGSLAWKRMHDWEIHTAKEHYQKLKHIFETGICEEDFYGILDDTGISVYGEYVYQKGQSLSSYLKKHTISPKVKYPLPLHDIIDASMWRSRDDISIGKESSDWSEEIDEYIDALSEDTVLACVDYHI